MDSSEDSRPSELPLQLSRCFSRLTWDFGVGQLYLLRLSGCLNNYSYTSFRLSWDESFRLFGATIVNMKNIAVFVVVVVIVCSCCYLAASMCHELQRLYIQYLLVHIFNRLYAYVHQKEAKQKTKAR